MSRFRFSVGPWNIAEGTDQYGPPTRKSLTFEQKLEKIAELGFAAVQFHDDDAVPDISEKGEAEIVEEAGEVKKKLDSYGLKAEFVAPRLWFEPQFCDGAYSALRTRDWEHALWRSFRSVDVARALDTDMLVLWLAREGTVSLETKSPVKAINQIIDSIDQILAYDDSIRVAIEPKPNEPIDRSYAGTAGHALALAGRTASADRVGLLVESAHSTMAGLEPTHDMAFGLAFGKLFSVHLNDQNSIRFDQDKSFGAENLRSSFNQIKLLCDAGYGSNGEYIGIDAKAMRATGDEFALGHLTNTMRIVELMEEKYEQWEQEVAEAYTASGDYEGAELYALEILLGTRRK